MFANKTLVPEMVRLRKFSLRLTKDIANSDDLLQSTLLRALENKEKFTEGTNLFHWTSRIMFNLFVSGYRKQVRYGSQYDPEPHINKLAVESNQENSTDVSIVGDAMKKLPQDHREILTMICIHGYDYAEAANILGVPVGTVRSRLSRARVHLAVLLKPVAPIRTPAIHKGRARHIKSV